MTSAVVCVAGTMKQADRVVGELRNAGFSSADVSVLVARDHCDREQREAGSDGEVLVGALGLIGGRGPISGHAPFIAAGPILEALTGLDHDANALVHAMSEMGIPELEAKRYEAKLREGNIVISIHTANSEERAVARRVFERTGGDDISYTTEKVI